MKRAPKEGGSASLAALVLVVAFTAICAGACLMLGALGQALSRAETQRKGEAACEAALAAWIELYHAKVGEADSPSDEYALPGTLAGAAVSVEDASSRLNPRLASRDLIAALGLESLAAGANLDSFSSALEDILAGRPPRAGLDGAIPPAELLTSFSYADVNTSSLEAIEGVYARRSGNGAAASALAARLSTTSGAARRIAPDQLESLLAPDYALVFPLISVAPPYNVNFVPPALLEALLGLPGFGIADHEDRARLLLASRAGGKINSDRLVAALGMARENPVYLYLGTKTWFWRLRIVADGARLEAVLARIPPTRGTELEAERSPRLRLVYRRFGK